MLKGGYNGVVAEWFRERMGTFSLSTMALAYDVRYSDHGQHGLLKRACRENRSAKVADSRSGRSAGLVKP